MKLTSGLGSNYALDKEPQLVFTPPPQSTSTCEVYLFFSQRIHPAVFIFRAWCSSQRGQCCDKEAEVVKIDWCIALTPSSIRNFHCPNNLKRHKLPQIGYDRLHKAWSLLLTECQVFVSHTNLIKQTYLATRMMRWRTQLRVQFPPHFRP